MWGLPSILSLIRNKFNKFNNTGAQLLDSSIYLRTLKLLKNRIFGVKMSRFCNILCTLSLRNVTKSVNQILMHGVISLLDVMSCDDTCIQITRFVNICLHGFKFQPTILQSCHDVFLDSTEGKNTTRWHFYRVRHSINGATVHTSMAYICTYLIVKIRKITLKDMWTAKALIICLFGWFDSLRPINTLSVKQGRVFLGWTSTKLG